MHRAAQPVTWEGFLVKLGGSVYLSRRSRGQKPSGLLERRKRLIISLCILFALNIVLILLIQSMPEADAVPYKQGASGTVVREIQTRLQKWGYYTGKVDGMYGPKTTAAMKLFQRKNGLTVDGVAGARTMQALGLPAGQGGAQQSGREADLELLARVISAEARGEPYNGQVAVGAVILNRIKHPSFPNTLAGVVYQPGAFTCMVDGQFNKPVAASSRNAARDAMNGVDTSGGAIYYFNPVTATSKWIWSRPLIKVIGRHRFCR